MSDKKNKPEIPERFRPSRSILMVDRIMTHVIGLGGVMVIVAVFGIFIFIASQIIPLFSGAEVEKLGEGAVPPGEYLAMGVDEWGELPFYITPQGSVVLVPQDQTRPGETLELDLPEGAEISSLQYLPKFNLIVAGTTDGRMVVTEISQKKDFANDERVIMELSSQGVYDFGVPGAKVTRIAYGNGDTSKLGVGLLEGADGEKVVKALLLEKGRGMVGAQKIVVSDSFDLTDKIPGEPIQFLVDQQAEGILIGLKGGKVEYFHRDQEKIVLRQEFQPFGDLTNKAISSMDFILGDVSVVVTNPEGVNRIFSLYVPEGGDNRLFGQIKEFPALNSGGEFYSVSLRKKTYLIGSGSQASLRFPTTGIVRWEDDDLGFQIQMGLINGKNDTLIFYGDDGLQRFYSLKDPHPEGSFQAFFGKIWYEGKEEPVYAWQSTGGSNDFEPKLSMIPLLVGTLKGTFYAMIFALPIAFLSALYTSQFLHPKVKRVVKPTMEVMASLPSVVLGFLAALWLAPLLETKVPSVFLAILALPTSALAMGWAWSNLPLRYRRFVKPGWEYAAYFPVMVVACLVAWNLGPWVESWAFVVTEADGHTIADFRRWWPQATGTSFEQRNSLIVGFMMGFAVIPIIFTIAEDSLSNVPAPLGSASLALGASRWQTAMMVVLPTASPGIFSATMIGLGRAVGETMIVVMATGNTPIMEMNIFNGMRTLSANIAVELPEAPEHGTLFRALFLGAMLLFLMTFFVNTVAEVIRQRLRDKYKTI